MLGTRASNVPLPKIGNNTKVAICSVYMAAAVPNNDFRVWNEVLYAMIKLFKGRNMT